MLETLQRHWDCTLIGAYFAGVVDVSEDNSVSHIAHTIGIKMEVHALVDLITADIFKLRD
jgi:predicted neuraminidase